MSRFAGSLLLAVLSIFGATAACARDSRGRSGAGRRAPSAATASSAAPATAAFRRLLNEQWEADLRVDPMMATAAGDSRYDDRLPDASPDAIAKNDAQDAAFLQRFREIDGARLSPADRLDRGPDAVRPAAPRRARAYARGDARCCPTTASTSA